MPSYIISNREIPYEKASMTEIFQKYEKFKYTEYVYSGNDVRVMTVASIDDWDFFLDTEKGALPITDFFDAAWLSHFAIYDLYLHSTFDEFLRKY